MLLYGGGTKRIKRYFHILYGGGRRTYGGAGRNSPQIKHKPFTPTSPKPDPSLAHKTGQKPRKSFNQGPFLPAPL